MELIKLGFNKFNQTYLDNKDTGNLYIGRVSAEYRNLYQVYFEQGIINATIRGKFKKDCLSGSSELPTVGDWVLFEYILEENKGIIEELLPRKSKFSRKMAGEKTQEQVVASNIDYAFIVVALNYDFNVRRIERYIAVTWQSGAIPVLVLTKADLCVDLQDKLAELEDVTFGIDIHVIDNISNSGISQLKKYFNFNQTIVLLGSSGVGKSSLINNLMQQDIMKVGILRNNIDKGRHTTTHKQLLILPTGGIIIDTPGIRELQLWDSDRGIDHTFEDIEQLSHDCYFRDCTHTNEPKCAVQKAIMDGHLDMKRLNNYHKLQREQSYSLQRQEQSAAKIEKDKWKSIHKQIRKLNI